MTRDKSTGLPELPEGYVWRIREGNFGPLVDNRKTLVVEICHKSWWGKLTMVVEDNLLETHTRSLPPTPENVRKRAERAYRSFTNNLELWARQAEERKARQKLVGTYPPKKFNY